MTARDAHLLGDGTPDDAPRVVDTRSLRAELDAVAERIESSGLDPWCTYRVSTGGNATAAVDVSFGEGWKAVRTLWPEAAVTVSRRDSDRYPWSTTFHVGGVRVGAIWSDEEARTLGLTLPVEAP